MRNMAVSLLERGCGCRLWASLALALNLAAVVVVVAVAAGRPAAATEVAAVPAVVVSVLPLHSLVAALMEGLGSPYLLVRGGASPHDASLRPSDARALSAARLVVWAGPGLETFLVKPLGVLAAEARLLTLTLSPGLTLLERNQGPAGGAIDPHLWLDPRTATIIARRVATALSDLDPGNGPHYSANLARLLARLEALDAELAARLAPVSEIPYAVYHDAYTHFEARYGLRKLGAVTIDPSMPPGARRLTELRAQLIEHGAACVFAEPQFRPAAIAVLVEGTGARAATLDPLGAALAPGPEAYFVLMRDLADALVDCLEGG